MLISLKNLEKSEFQQLFTEQRIKYEGEDLNVLVRKDPLNSVTNARIFELLTKAGGGKVMARFSIDLEGRIKKFD